jgi:hypothetical protein
MNRHGAEDAKRNIWQFGALGALAVQSPNRRYASQPMPWTWELNREM